jgi:hypothetical protein
MGVGLRASGIRQPGHGGSKARVLPAAKMPMRPAVLPANLQRSLPRSIWFWLALHSC